MPDPRSRTFWSTAVNVLYIHGSTAPTCSAQRRTWRRRAMTWLPAVATVRSSAATAICWLAWRSRMAQTVPRRLTVRARLSPYYLTGWLPTNATRDAWWDLKLEFVDRVVGANGMIAEWATHALAHESGRWIEQPHLHVVLTHRF